MYSRVWIKTVSTGLCAFCFNGLLQISLRICASVVGSFFDERMAVRLVLTCFSFRLQFCHVTPQSCVSSRQHVRPFSQWSNDAPAMDGTHFARWGLGTLPALSSPSHQTDRQNPCDTSCSGPAVCQQAPLLLSDELRRHLQVLLESSTWISSPGNQLRRWDLKKKISVLGKKKQLS